jgi:hypothetical protein
MKNTNKGVDTMTCPCKGCTDREIGCHSKCSKYIEWKSEWDRRKNMIDNAKAIERIDGEIKVAGLKRMQKGKRR